MTRTPPPRARAAGIGRDRIAERRRRRRPPWTSRTRRHRPLDYGGTHPPRLRAGQGRLRRAPPRRRATGTRTHRAPGLGRVLDREPLRVRNHPRPRGRRRECLRGLRLHLPREERMSHLDYASEGGVWAPEMVPGAAHFYRWDLAHRNPQRESRRLVGALKPDHLGRCGRSVRGAGARSAACARRAAAAHPRGPRHHRALAAARTPHPDVALAGDALLAHLAQQPGAVPEPERQALHVLPDTYFLKAIPAPFASGLFLQDVGQPIAIPIPKAYLHTRGHAAPFDGQLASVTLNYRVLARPGGFQSVGAVPFLTVYSAARPGGRPGVTPPAVTRLALARTGILDDGLLGGRGAAYFTLGQYYNPISFRLRIAFARHLLQGDRSTGPGLTGASVPGVEHDARRHDDGRGSDLAVHRRTGRPCRRTSTRSTTRAPRSGSRSTSTPQSPKGSTRRTITSWSESSRRRTRRCPRPSTPSPSSTTRSNSCLRTSFR